MPQPTPDQMTEAIERIRVEAPVDYLAASKEVNAGIARQNAAIRAQLEAWGLTWSTINDFGTCVEGRHVWHTAIITFETGNTSLSGRWGDNPTEVELHVRLGTYAFRRPGVTIEVFEDPESVRYYELKKAAVKAEKQLQAIHKKAQKVKAKYTDTTTPAQLKASQLEGMLF